jgi:ornithine cyclodeaminase
VRLIGKVTLWNRTPQRAVRTAFGLSVGGLEVEVTDDLEVAVGSADIVSCATLSAEPLVRSNA